MIILWVFLATFVVNTCQANFCRVCIDKSIIVSADEAISYLVQAVVENAQDEIKNCTTKRYMSCDGACVSVDYYSDNETDAYLGSLRSCYLGEQYNVNNASYYAVCVANSCNAAVPINKSIHYAADLFFLTMVLLGSLVALLISLMLWKTVGCSLCQRKEATFEGIEMFPETPDRIQIDELEVDHDDNIANESDMV